MPNPNMPTLDSIKAIANAQFARLDVTHDGKVDLLDAQKIAHDAAAEAANFARAFPWVAIITAFAIGVIVTLFIVSIRS